MKNYSIYIGTFLFLFLGVSCKDFVDVAPSSDLPVNKDVFASNEKATRVLLGILGDMVTHDFTPYHMAFFAGLAGDELKNFSNDYFQEFYTNSIDPESNMYCNLFWAAAYKYIYRANDLYEGCNDSNTLDPAVKKQLMAEALLIRAYWHFYLVNFFGDIPIAIQTSFTKNAVLPRMPVTKVYEQIIADLKKAQKDLSINYVGANSITANEERGRPNQATATALLARVYLYTGEYSMAEEEASKLINAHAIYGLTALDSVFLKNSKEAIWQLMPSEPSPYQTNTPDGKGFILTNIPQLSDQATISTQLLHCFENGDQRQKSWISFYEDKTVKPAVRYYFPYKYKVKDGTTVTEYSMLFRLAEQYLIRAEARAHLGKLQEAISDIDVIRQRAGLPLLFHSHPGMSQTELLQAVFTERQRELFTEQAHRWLDLKRTGNIDAVMDTVSPLKGGPWKAQMQYFPIPSIEIRRDPSLKQNPGYP